MKLSETTKRLPKRLNRDGTVSRHYLRRVHGAGLDINALNGAMSDAESLIAHVRRCPVVPGYQSPLCSICQPTQRTS